MRTSWAQPCDHRRLVINVFRLPVSNCITVVAALRWHTCGCQRHVALNLCALRRHRLKLTGLSTTNENDSIGPVSYEPWLSPGQWVLPFGLKKQVFGEKGRISVGGTIEGLEAVEEHQVANPPPDVLEDALPGINGFQINPGRGQGGHEKRLEENEEIVFFHTWPVDLYSELIHAVAAEGILDLTCGAGNCAKAALLARIQYVGVTLTDMHRRLLQTHLHTFVWKGLANSESQSLYHPEVAKVMKNIPAMPSKPKASPTPKAKVTSKPKVTAPAMEAAPPAVVANIGNSNRKADSEESDG